MGNDRDPSRKSVTETTVRRRDVLHAAVVSGTVAGLSGCLGPLTGDSDDDDSDTPERLIPEGETVRLEPVADGLTYPTDLAGPPNDLDGLFVTDQVGVVYRIVDGETEPFLDISDRVLDVEGGFSERGLLGIEFHPEFGSNGRFYLRYSGSSDDLTEGMSHVEYLSEFVVEDGEVDPDSETHVLELEQPSVVHNSGDILFGPDGYLYVPTGDGGGPFRDRPQDWYDENDGGPSQDTTTALLGGVLRIDVDGDEPYAIPPDNPLVDEDGHLDEYYAWGFRNPWGSSFDGDDLYVADVGEVLFESVNLVEKGGNYGWNVREGTHCFDTGDTRNPPEDCPDETPDDVRGGEQLRDPVIEYPQEHDGIAYGSAVIGGSVYRGEELPELEGSYVFGDWSKEPHQAPNGALYAASPPEEGEALHPYNEERGLWQIRELVVEATESEETDIGEDGNLNRYVAGFGRAGDDIYVMTTATNEVGGETGTIHRLTTPE